jgi:Family of unknown function (DUF5990)
MRVVIKGHRFPGRTCGPHHNVHVGLQVGSRPDGLVPGDATEARWTTDVRVIETEDGRDFSGPAVQGRRGERFLYLTWGELAGNDFAMFRRAKLMLDDLPRTDECDEVSVLVELTDPQGGPICARVKEPVAHWVAV